MHTFASQIYILFAKGNDARFHTLNIYLRTYTES